MESPNIDNKINIPQREKELFKKVIQLHTDKNKNYFDEIIQLLKKSLSEVQNEIDEDKLFRIKIILTLGKFYLKNGQDNLIEIIEIIENENKINLNLNLISLLYRCYYLIMVKEKEKLSNKGSSDDELSKMYSLHQLSQDLIKKVEKKNLSDISMSKYRFISKNFKLNYGKGQNGSNNKIDLDLFYQQSSIFTNSGSIQFKIPVNLISCGRYFSMVLDSNGSVWNWGEISNNQDSPIFPNPSPKVFKSIAAGFHHCLALSEDGCVYGWGINNFGSLGQIIGDGKYCKEMKPLEFKEKIVKIEAGGFNSAFIGQDTGSLYVLGRNNRLQLGFQESPSLYPRIDNQRIRTNFIPEITISPSEIPREFSNYLSNPKYSDLHILFDNEENTIYLHLALFLSQLSTNGFKDNFKLLKSLKQLKQQSTIVKLKFSEFLNLVIHNSQETIESILSQPIEDQRNQFFDFCSFIYTNIVLKRYSSQLVHFYSKIFKLPELEKYVLETFSYISDDSNLKISDKLYSFCYQGKEKVNENNSNNQNSKENWDDFLSDCIVSNNEGYEIKCHKVILSSRSNYFDKLIIEQQKDSNNIDSDSGLLKLKLNIETSKLILILSYIYSDRIKLVSIPPSEITGNFILSLYQESKEFGLTRFEEGLLKLVSQSVSEENAQPLLNWATKNNASPLKKFINAFLQLDDAPAVTQSGRDGAYSPLCPLPNIKVVDVAVGQKLMLVVTDENKIYQLGCGSDLYKSHINLIKLPTTAKVFKVSCGSSHCLAMTEDFKIFGWGCGLEGQVIESQRKMFVQPQLLFESNYNNMKASLYSSLFWTDSSTYPLNLTSPKKETTQSTNTKTSSSSSSSSLSKEILDKFKNLNIKDNEEITINIFSNSSASKLWYFKQFKSFKDNFTINSNNLHDKVSISTVKTNISNLPPFLLLNYLHNIDNRNKNELNLFGFSKETLEILLSLKEFNNDDTKLKLNNLNIIQSIKSGDLLIDLLFLSTCFGLFSVSNLIFQHLKIHLSLTDSILLLSCIYESNYQIQLSFLFNYLLGILNHNKFEILSNENMLKLLSPNLLDLILYCNVVKPK